MLGLIAAGGFLLINSKKSPVSSYKLPPLTKEARGYEVSEDCKNIIIYDKEKAFQFAFEFGKNSSLSSIMHIENMSEKFYGKCTSKDFIKNENNDTFTYELVLRFLAGVVSSHKSGATDILIVLWLIFLPTDKKYSGITRPIDLPILNNIIIPMRGYDTDGCKQFVITNEKLMYLFVRKISKSLSDIIFDTVDIDQKYIIMFAVFADFCNNKDFKDNLTSTQHYMIMYNFLQVQYKNKKITRDEGNDILTTMLESDEFPGIDGNVPKSV